MNQSQNRYEFLDALRGFAILGVLAVHCAIATAQGFPLVRFAYAGEYGVQLFFMISAFTIFLTLDRAEKKGNFSVPHFYIRRFFRILPMFWVGILLYTFLPGREIRDAEFAPGIGEYVLTAVLQHGWHPSTINTVVPGGWTLAVEGTFYLLAPLLFIFIKTWQRAFFFLVACLAIAEISVRALGLATDHFHLFAAAHPKASEFFPIRWFPSQLPVFACGILTFFIWRSLPTQFHTKRNGTAFLLAGGIILVSSVAGGPRLLLSEGVQFAVGFIFLVLSFAIHPGRLFVNFFTCFLGKISYSFYLLHFAVLELAIYSVKLLFPQGLSGLPMFVFLYLATLVLTSPLAFLTYKFVESPFIALGSSLIRKSRPDTPVVVPPDLASS